jgi:hypothetical protein
MAQPCDEVIDVCRGTGGGDFDRPVG